MKIQALVRGKLLPIPLSPVLARMHRRNRGRDLTDA
jgi:hypothetical protein